MNRKLKIATFAVADVLAVVASISLSTLLCEYAFIEFFAKYWYFFLVGFFISILCNVACKLYSNLIKFASFNDMLRVVISAFLTGLYYLFIALIVDGVSIAWAVQIFFIYFFIVGFSRFAFCLTSIIGNANKRSDIKANANRIMIIGAGSAGDMLIREMKTSTHLNMFPVCALDDDSNKVGQYIDGVKVVGKTDKVVEFAEKHQIDEIIVAMPSVSRKRTSEILSNCQKTQCKVKVIPGVYQSASAKISVSKAQDINIQDLLGREQVNVNLGEIMGYIEERIILVTGGGGSIGSELCRQIAEHNPKQLIILDIYENNAYEIQQELVRKYPNLNLLVLIASVRDSKKINNVFKTYRPHIVFHAAAHKHVPLMETSPNEAVKNNVSGTFKVADAAGRFGAERFILISTDKAVNPTNIMGATKRICEMIVQTMDKRYDTEYVAVRFGNVLGSNGSVIPLFKRQIEEGGPVTVTHKDIVRYFMTIPEAVSLVLQAGAYAKGGEIFVLDMGDPVKIYDLAFNMIKLCGYEPFKDIDIKITGLRPGEKLYEERLMEEEGLLKTENEMISIGKPLDIDEKNLFDKIHELYVEAYNETDKMKELIHELVPTYKIDTRKFSE